MEKNS